MRFVWWKCSHGHSWRAKIADRAIDKCGCAVCESEYRSVFPKLMAAYYARKKGIQIELDSDKRIGLPLDTYMPDEELAIDFSENAQKGINNIIKFICSKNGIRYRHIPFHRDMTEIELAKRIKGVFREYHIFISSNEIEDAAQVRKLFYNWRSRTK